MAGVREIVSRPTKNNRMRCPLFTVGVDRCKDLIFYRLKMQRVGPGYMHFPTRYDEEFFEQLTAEERRDKYIQGKKISYYHQARPHNEALDLSVYNVAAVELLSPDFDALKPEEVKEAPPPQKRHPLVANRPTQNFATSWKR